MAKRCRRAALAGPSTRISVQAGRSGGAAPAHRSTSCRLRPQRDQFRLRSGYSAAGSCGVASPLMADPETTYRRQTPGSRALHDSAVAVMPVGTTRTTTYFDPYPLYITRGEGCRGWDADGTERLDMLANYTAMILGHAHPEMSDAIRKQAAQGTVIAAANPMEGQLTALLSERP